MMKIDVWTYICIERIYLEQQIHDTVEKSGANLYIYRYFAELKQI